MPSGRVEISDVRVAFGDTAVLHGVNFDVAPGEIVALLGPSGCGKTTLLRSIAGLERISGGTISLNGKEVATIRRHVRPEARLVGLAFQDWALFPHMTVEENVATDCHVRPTKLSRFLRCSLRSVSMASATGCRRHCLEVSSNVSP